MLISLDKYLGKIALVGINFFDAEENLIGQFQTHGTIKTIDDLNIIHLEQSNGNIYKLPFSIQAIREAAPGTYTFRSTGEEIENPSFLIQFRVNNSNEENAEKYMTCGFDPAEWEQE